jgi:glycosyltransferase involved in cell wall biosynthesis
LADELAVAERIDFVGALPNAEVRQRLGGAGGFVLPCREAADGDRDGIPVVLMEAMARRVPVISGDLPTIRELVTDNVSGLMVRPGAVDELSEAILRLAQDGPLRRRLAEAGRARVAEEFSLSVNLDRLQTAFAAAAHPRTPANRVAPLPGGVHA